ncbi:sugar phosphate isomerase/epimerase family protein [Ottowia thiooxydans]|uniref:sugar phosphate isomerase/epimerase family protein n=1 Tax=Ottowia thiooxydans TaxID=219182 RepID=UPI0004918402|nr:sugar phosphate isomerase/epimerase family protein [Ottowia thiooxydans]
MKLAICNEVLAHLPFEQQCALAASLGYQGLEIAPFTLAPDPATIEPATAQAWARTAADHGLLICGLHWLLARPEGMSITTTNEQVRRRTFGFLERMIEIGAACGAQVLVHGSPRQRAPEPGQSVDDATARAADLWASLAERASTAGLIYCIEPLAPATTPVVNTLAQAAAIVDAVGSPALRTMLDLGASEQAEAQAPEQVLRHHLALGHIAHVQLNDRNRRGPGQGDTSVAPVLQALRDGGYAGWVSIEPFDFYPSPEACAAFSSGYVRGLWQAVEEPRVM